MRYPLSEKLEIIRLVERSHLPAKRTLAQLGIPRTSFYRWYDRYLTGGPEALEDRRSRPGQVWNRIPDEVRDRIVQLKLDKSAVSRRVKGALADGFLKNNEEKRGKPARLVVGDPLPDDVAFLPTADQVPGAVARLHG